MSLDKKAFNKLYLDYAANDNEEVLNECFEMLYKYLPRLVQYQMKRSVSNLSMIEDIVQETAISLWGFLKKKKFDVKRGNIITITLYKARNALAKDMPEHTFNRAQLMLDDADKVDVLTRCHLASYGTFPIPSELAIQNVYDQRLLDYVREYVTDRMKWRIKAGRRLNFSLDVLSLILDKELNLITYSNYGKNMPEEYYELKRKYAMQNNIAIRLKNIVIISVRWGYLLGIRQGKMEKR